MVRIREKFVDSITVLADGYVGPIDATGERIANSSGTVFIEQPSVPGGLPEVGEITLWARDSDGYLVCTDSTGREVIVNGTGGGGGNQTLAQTLVFGNNTGGSDIVLGVGDQINGDGDIVLDSDSDGYIILKRGITEVARWDSGGSERLLLGAEAIQFAEAITAPIITQESTTNPGFPLTIAAQNGGSQGGDLHLAGGYGNAVDSSVCLHVNGADSGGSLVSRFGKILSTSRMGIELGDPNDAAKDLDIAMVPVSSSSRGFSLNIRAQDGYNGDLNGGNLVIGSGLPAGAGLAGRVLVNSGATTFMDIHSDYMELGPAGAKAITGTIRMPDDVSLYTPSSLVFLSSSTVGLQIGQPGPGGTSILTLGVSSTGYIDSIFDDDTHQTVTLWPTGWNIAQGILDFAITHIRPDPTVPPEDGYGREFSIVGQPGSGSGGYGGPVSLYGGIAGESLSGPGYAGGTVGLYGGHGGIAPTSSDGGAGGAVILQGGTGGFGDSANGGAGGEVHIEGGHYGNVNIGSLTSNGGPVEIIGGNSLQTAGGSVKLIGGLGEGGNGFGGNVELRPGSGSLRDGYVALYAGVTEVARSDTDGGHARLLLNTPLEFSGNGYIASAAAIDIITQSFYPITGAYPADAAYDNDGYIWVAGDVSGTVKKVEVTTGLVIDTIAAGTNIQAICFGDGYIWAVDFGSNNALKIDPINDLVVATIGVGAAPSGIGYGFGSVWVANFGGATVSRIDPILETVAATIGVGGGPIGFVFSGSHVWVSNRNDATISKTDPSTNLVIATISLVSVNPWGGCFDGTYVWFACYGSLSVVKIDTALDSVVDTVALSQNNPMMMLFDGSRVLVTNAGSGTVSVINPVSDVIAETITLSVSTTPMGMAYDGTDVWVTDNSPNPGLSKISIGSSTPAGSIIIKSGTTEIARFENNSGDPRLLFAESGNPVIMQSDRIGENSTNTIYVTGQNADSTAFGDFDGGYIELRAGDGINNGDGGNVEVYTGVPGSGGNGGDLALYAHDGSTYVTSSGDGGNVYIESGGAVGGGSAGEIIIKAGLSGGAGGSNPGGNVTIQPGVSATGIDGYAYLKDADDNIMWSVGPNGISANTNLIHDVVDPIAAQDVATKNYIDNVIVISPTILSSNEDDYTPVAWTTASVVRLSTEDDGYTISGFAADSSKVYRKIINVGSFNLTLTNLDGNSLVANQIIVPGGISLIMSPNDTVDLFYDVVSSKWRCV